MKGLILVIFIFIICALIGFQVANWLDQSNVIDQESSVKPTEFSQARQYSLMVVHVDRLDNPDPRLMSVWFVSLFFVDGSPPILTIAPIFPSHSRAADQALGRAFSLDGQGEPNQNFWKTIRSKKFKWDAFLLVDDFTVQKVMEWTNGPGNYPQVLENVQNDPAGSKQVLIQTCQSIGRISERGKAPFQLGDLAPAHLHSNLRMELALDYWNKLTTSELPIGCEVP
jgi:hypothetical protein